MVPKIEQPMQKLATTSTDPSIIEISKEFQNEIIQKDQQLQALREDINYLSKKMNEQERYLSKKLSDCLKFTLGYEHFLQCRRYNIP